MKKLLTLILTAVLLLTACFSLTACGKIDDVKAIKEKKEIIIGITDYEPMDYKDENGKWIGFDAELAEMFAAELGVACKFVEIDWDMKVGELNSKAIDVIWNGMTASEELGENIDFSVSYAKNAQVAVVKADSSINTKEAVIAAKVAVESGSAGNEVALEIGVAEAKLAAVDDQNAALNEVVAGTSEVAIIDLTMAQSKLGKGSYVNLKMVDGFEFGAEIFAVGLRKNSNLKTELDSFLKAKYADGTMANLVAKYPSVVVNADALSAK